MNLLSSFIPSSFTFINKVGFDDLLVAINNPNNFLIISTLPKTEQDFLICGTIPFETEEKKMNEIIESGKLKKYKIIIYGKNSTDLTVETKYKQLLNLGFTNVYLYYGGIFEWVLLRDIYGEDLFPSITTNVSNNNINLLKWKPNRIF